MSKQVKKGLGDPAITPSVSGSNLAQSGEDFRLPPIAPAHTPGPWYFRHIEWGSEVSDDWVVCEDLGDGTGRHVAHVTHIYQGDRRPLVELANAKLISAAPDLLAALQAFEKVDDFSGWHPNYSDAIEAARAAIVKATK